MHIHMQQFGLQMFPLSAFPVIIIIMSLGFEVWHLAVDVMAVYFILWLLGGSIAAVTLTWIVTMVTTPSQIC